MGRQPYLMCLVLGRSAFETPVSQVTEDPLRESSSYGSEQPNENTAEYVQEYDARGNPENRASQNAAKRTRRALNDVLAFAGVCTPVRDSKALLQHRQAILNATHREAANVSENEEDVGFWLQRADFLGQWLVGYVFTDFRLKLLTFNYHEAPNIWSIWVEVVRGGTKSLFAGLMTHSLFTLFDLARIRGENIFFREAISPAIERIQSFHQRARVQRIVNAIRFTVDKAAYITLASLELHISLQQLRLVKRPLFAFAPIRTSLRFWSLSFLPQLPVIWSLKTSTHFLASLLLSPPILFYLLRRGIGFMDGWTSTLLHQLFPSPEERQSMWSLGRFKSGDSMAAIAIDCLQSTYMRAKIEARNYWLEFESLVLEIIELAKSPVRDVRTKPLPTKPSPDSSDDDTSPESDATSQSDDEGSEHEDALYTLHAQAELHSWTVPMVQTPTFTIQSDTGAAEAADETSTDAGDEIEYQLRPEDIDAMMRLSSDTDRIPTNAGHEMERQLRPEDIDELIRLSSAAELAQQRGIRKEYCTSQLSTHAAETLRHHVKCVAWGFLLIPLEAMYARSLANSYLLSQSPLGNRVVYPMGSWFGAGPWPLRYRYAKNLLLCSAAEMAASYGVWQVTAGMAWWIGKHWFWRGRGLMRD